MNVELRRPQVGEATVGLPPQAGGSLLIMQEWLLLDPARLAEDNAIIHRAIDLLFDRYGDTLQRLQH